MNENQVGVILEEVPDMFKTLAEGQKVLEEGQKVLKEEVKEIKSEIKTIKQDIKVIKTFMGNIEDGINDHELNKGSRLLRKG